MHLYHFIARHLTRESGAHSGQCALCGASSDDLHKKKDILSSCFTDTAKIRFESQFVCSYCAACLGGKAFNGKAIRNYNLMVTDHEIKAASKQDILDYLLTPSSDPIVIIVTYNGKKHAFFNARINTQTDVVIVGTDKYQVSINVHDLLIIYPILQQMYDFGFSKTDLESLDSQKFNQIEKFGTDDYYKNIEVLRQFAGTHAYQLIIFLLQKKEVKND